MNDIVEILLIFVGWIILAKYILPALGIPTCMSGQCRVSQKPKDSERQNRNE